jgi:FMN phosphatase YigB (HAD superfamily)
MVKTLFIDWGQTLSISRFWSQLSEANHPYHYYHEIIIDWLFNKNCQLVEQWMLGAVTAEQVCHELALKNGLNQSVIFKTLQESCQQMSLCFPELPKIVSQIKQKGLKVVIATDNMDTFRRFTIKSLGLDKIFDDFLISCELKALKYSTKNDRITFFDQFLEANNLSYNEVELLDDSLDKSGVYQKLGFKIKLIKNSNGLLKNLKSYLN